MTISLYNRGRISPNKYRLADGNVVYYYSEYYKRVRQLSVKEYHFLDEITYV